LIIAPLLQQPKYELTPHEHSIYMLDFYGWIPIEERLTEEVTIFAKILLFII
jgi:hypothetical protein